MSFDWEQLLTSRGIEFNARGPNTSGGNIAVRCPFCDRDDDDPRYRYMSISLSGSGWRCFRRPADHRGRSPVRLIAALLRCTHEEAARIAGVRDLPVSLADHIRARLSPRAASESVQQPSLEWPKELRELSTRATALPYLSYLSDRLEILPSAALEVARERGLRWASSGPYAGRVVFPVRLDDRLVSWTGRSIGRSELRYKTLSTDPEKAAAEGLPTALSPTSDVLLFCDDLARWSERARVLLICEGPFDALKVHVLGRELGIAATCLFGLNLSPAQVGLLGGVVQCYDQSFLLLDRGTLSPALRMRGILSQIGVGLRHLPEGVKDPGKLSWHHLDFLARLITIK
jgi:hypothetical protein